MDGQVTMLEERTGEIIKSDVLVLGGGIGACYAAIKASESGSNIVLVDKGNTGRSGFSPMMSGVFSYFDPEKDDYDAYFREALEIGEWLNDQECLEVIIKETSDRVKEMLTWGVKFQKERGELIRRPGAGSLTRQNVLMTNSGFQLMSILKGEVLRRRVRVIDRVMVTDLLTSDGEAVTGGRIVGAVGFNIRTGKFYVFKAKTTIIATGSTNSILGYAAQRNLSGDGKAMAFKAGCEMRNIDLAWWEPAAVGQTTSAGFGILGGEGTHFINAKGDRLMRRWDPQRMERASRVVVGRAMAIEELEGRGPCYWDATHLDEAAHSKFEKCIPIIIRNFAARGLDLRKDKIHYGLVMGDEIVGGIRVNIEYATSISALYAAGDVADGISMGVCSAVGGGQIAAIGGYHAGKSAAKYAAEIGEPVINERQVQLLKAQIFAPMKREAGLSHQEVRQHCINVIEKGLLGPVKNESKLKEAIAVAQEIRNGQIPKLVARDYHELARSIGVDNELLFLELFPKCSLLRTESRGAHYREDYPERDDEDWLKWVVAQKKGDGIKVWAEPIPFERYPLKPALKSS